MTEEPQQICIIEINWSQDGKRPGHKMVKDLHHSADTGLKATASIQCAFSVFIPSIKPIIRTQQQASPLIFQKLTECKLFKFIFYTVCFKAFWAVPVHAHQMQDLHEDFSYSVNEGKPTHDPSLGK